MSSILSGLRPEVIMEICTRAISFWTYQTSQEAKYQEMTRKSLEDKLSLVEKQLQRMTRDVNIELSGMHAVVMKRRDTRANEYVNWLGLTET
ncbi:hypothetical protein BGZ51_004896 [Haplosporangium sp. Z 767]|nr:hypothetical protein BGZ51_004896 [Haplosporangium sp. Z 767]